MVHSSSGNRDAVTIRGEGMEGTWSPVIVKAMEQDEEFKEDVKEVVDEILMLIWEEIE